MIYAWHADSSERCGYKKYVALPQSGEYRGWLHINKIGGGHFNSVELDMNFMQIIEKQIEKSLILFK